MADENNKLQLVIEVLTKEVGEKRAKEILAEAKVGTDDLTRETEKSTTATEDFNVHGRAQFLLFSEINRILPGLGTAMHAAFAGPLGPIILVGVAIAAAKNALNEYNAELDKMGDAAAAGHAQAIQAVRDAWDNVEEGMAKYFADLQAAAQDKDPTTTLIKNLKALEEETFKARIEQMKLLGRPQAEIDAAKDEHDRKTVAMLQEEKNMRVADLANAQFAIDKDKERAALADARVKSRKDELEALQKPDPDLEARVEKARGTLEFRQKQLTEAGYQDVPEATRLRDEAKSALNVLMNEQRLRERRRQELEDKQQADLTAKAEAGRALTADQSKAVSAQTRITELSGPQGEITQTGLRESVDAAARHGNEVIEEANKLIKSHRDLFGELAATLRYYNQRGGGTDPEIAALWAEINRLKSVQGHQAQSTMNQ
ncbi:MAG: hypothetical protein WBW41_14825 [Verrucomicrobiia bacterium]